MKLGDWDPDVFFKFRDCILNHAPACGQKLRNDLCRGIPRVWDNYYMMDMEKVCYSNSNPRVIPASTLSVESEGLTMFPDLQPHPSFN